MHKIFEFYKQIYKLAFKIPKKDRLGIYLKIENICLDLLQLLVTASLESKSNKLVPLNSARIKIELVKKLVRLMSELDIINDNQYISLESNLQEISKMTNGWIKYINS